SSMDCRVRSDAVAARPGSWSYTKWQRQRERPTSTGCRRSESNLQQLEQSSFESRQVLGPADLRLVERPEEAEHQRGFQTAEDQHAGIEGLVASKSPEHLHAKIVRSPPRPFGPVERDGVRSHARQPIRRDVVLPMRRVGVHDQTANATPRPCNPHAREQPEAPQQPDGPEERRKKEDKSTQEERPS